jgi:xylan 1,4-beta-xylosidase
MINRLFLVAILCPLFLAACSAGDEKINFQPETSMAYFDDFCYRGMDDYYLDHPLEKEDQFYNPILPGWYSDPSICRNGEDYFLVTSTFSYFPGVPIFHSRDLVNWIQIGHVLDRSSQLPLDGQRISEGIFAPAISYNSRNGTYYMITTNIRRGNFYVTTKDPFGPWSDPVWLPGVGGIDPSFFFDDDGKAYIVNNDAPDGAPLYEGHRAIRVQQFDVESGKVFGPRKMIVNGGVNIAEKPIWIEGPHIYKIDGAYYLMDAEGGTGPQHSEVIFRGDSPMGPYVPWDKNPILTQRHLDPERENPVTCTGHADLVQTPEGDWWAVFLACRPIENMFENLGRETFLMPVGWSGDGYPFMTRGEEEVPLILEKEGVVRDNVTFGNFEIRDVFKDTLLDMTWMTLRSPGRDLYSLTGQPGYLSLKCSGEKATGKGTPALVLRRIQHHKFECSTSMVFDPAAEDVAGLLLFKDEGHQYFLSVGRSAGGPEAALLKISRSGEEDLARIPLKPGTRVIGLKVISHGTTFDFYVSREKDQWELLLADVDARYLSTANSFGFTGTTIGLYATRKEPPTIDRVREGVSRGRIDTASYRSATISMSGRTTCTSIIQGV